MPLTLLLGPANCGKVALLLDRFRAAADGGQSPFLVVPTRPDVEAAEREVLARDDAPALLGGQVGTFDDLFDTVLERCGDGTRQIGGLGRRMLVEELVAAADLRELRPSSRFPGFADGLGRLFDDLAETAEPGEMARRLRAFAAPGRRAEIDQLYTDYRARLAALGVADRAGRRARAAELLAGRLDAWDEAPVLAYGFEDVSGVQRDALRSLAGRCQVTVSLPYEVGRDAFAAVRPVVDDLAALADETVTLPPAEHVHAPVLAHLERQLFDARTPPPAPDPAGIERFEACGRRGVADQVAAEALALIRAGTAPDQIAVIVPDAGPWRIVMSSAFAAHGIPVEVDATVPFARTSFGGALLALTRFAWFGGDRTDLFVFLRSPFSGIARRTVDWAEGRLRGRGVVEGEAVRTVLEELDYVRLLGAAERLGRAEDVAASIRSLVAEMASSAFGLDARVAPAAADPHLRAIRSLQRALAELEEMAALGVARPDRAALADQLGRLAVRVGRDSAPGRVAVLDLRRARTRRWDAVFVLGLEEGVLPRPAAESPYLTQEDEAALGIARLDPGDRDRHLFYTAVTRPWSRLYLCREAADEEGRLREPSPFLADVERALSGADIPRRRRPLGELTWEVEEAPTERERLRSLARASRDRTDWATATADQLGGRRKLQRALAAHRRQTALRHPAVLAALAEQERFSVTELEKFADCSSAWFVERLLSPGEIDYEFGPKERGSVAHAALHRFFAGLPRELGVEGLSPEVLEPARAFMRRCLADALANARVPATAAGKEAVRALERDLEGFLVRETELASPLVPRRFEVRFGTRSSPPELQDGLRLNGFAVSGTIDRIDTDPAMSARGAVWDYKTSRDLPKASSMDRAARLQIPLYVLAARELLGTEPVAGLYRGLSGNREARGMAVKGEIDGLAARDQLDEAEFWDMVDRAVVRAERIVGRLRGGDVRHDPLTGECPAWCVRRVGGICRVRS